MRLPYSELQPRVFFARTVVEDHGAADHKGVLVQQRVWDAVRAGMQNLIACLTLIQAFKPNQGHHLMKPAYLNVNVGLVLQMLMHCDDQARYKTFMQADFAIAACHDVADKMMSRTSTCQERTEFLHNERSKSDTM